MDERDAYAAVAGQVILQLRKGRMSQEALAKKAQLSQSALSRFENGQTLPDVYELRALASALEEQPHQLTAKIEIAFARARDEARRRTSPDAAKKAAESPWSGVAAVMLAAFAMIGVAAMLDEAEKKNTRKKS
jgi:transcriptional regulator with XRE-family HTH domain